MRAPLEITETLNRAIEVMNPQSPMFGVVAELANYVDFEVVMTKKNSQNHYEANTYEDQNEQQAEAEAIKAPQVQENIETYGRFIEASS